MSKGKPQQRGVLVRTTETKDGRIRISLDDLVNSDDKGAIWKYDVHVTAKDFKASEFESLELPEKELADFGYYVLARLRAYNKAD